MIAHYAWADGLAIVVEAADQPMASVFEPDGWRRGDPKLLLPDGPPAGAARVAMTLPAWLDDSLGLLELSMAGLHTDFVRIDRLIGRLQSQGAQGVVLVLGPSSAAAVLSGGQLVLVEPQTPEGMSPLAAFATASGWILVFDGRVEVPGPPVHTPAGAEPVVEAPAREAAAAVLKEAQAPAVASPVVETPAVETPAPQPSGPAPGAHAAGERFMAASGLADALPGDVAEVLRAMAGEAGIRVVALLDGTLTAADIAARVGLSPDQVTGVVKALVSRKLAFRYVARVRSTSVRRTPR